MQNLFLLLAISFSVNAQLFIPERGRYDLTNEDINQLFGLSQSYLRFVPEKSVPGARYKWNERRNEFQIKDWYKHDWFALQDMYTLDFDAYLAKFGATNFNQAKRRQYLQFPFDMSRYYHRKKTPAMKEWGGLTHPPVKELTRSLEQYHPRYVELDYQKIQSPYFDPFFQFAIDKDSHSELSFGNKVHALEDRMAYNAKLWLISKAKSRIFMSSLVFLCDETTKKLVDLLIKRKKEGLEVKVIVDSFDTKIFGATACTDKMEANKIEVMLFKEAFHKKIKALYHTKTLIVDDEEALAGGSNMIDADNSSRGLDFKNRDVDLYVKGPLVLDMAKQFMENWNYHLSEHGRGGKNLSPLTHGLAYLKQKIEAQRSQNLRGPHMYTDILKNPQTRMKGVCRFIKQAPHEDRYTIGKTYLRLAGKAQDYIAFTNPLATDTVVNDFTERPLLDRFDSHAMFTKLHNKFIEMARKGRKIDYIATTGDMAGNENVAVFNEIIREKLKADDQRGALWNYLKLEFSNWLYAPDHHKNMLKDWVYTPNVSVWHHISFLHSKIFYFDRVIAAVGSANFIHNGTDQAYESTVVCLDKDLNKQLDRILVQDMVNSIPFVFSGLER